MHDLWTTLLNVYLYVAQASTYSIATIIIVSLVQLVGRRWIPAKWSYALWLILLVRMALPSGPESSLSLWNLVPLKTLQLMPSELKQQIKSSEWNQVSSPLLGETHIQVNAEEIERFRQQGESKAKSIPWAQGRLIPAIWLAGALSLLIIIALSNLRLWWSVRKIRMVTAQPLLELLEDCKQLIGIRTVVGLAITDRIQSPSLFGFIRPRILIPAGLDSHIPMEEMRYIFLHELAHLKRGDIWIGWIVAVLQSLHWFNPLVWWSFIRMRADRELACDALALSYLGDKDSHLYGSALINLLENFNHSQHLPAVAGILENKSQLKRRLTMITHFNRPTRKASIFAAALLVALATGLLTNAKELSSYQHSSELRGASAENQETSHTSPGIVEIGGDAMESKLIRKVNPVYPEQAKALRLSGKVVLSVTVNEEGFVSDIQVSMGHPLMREAATTAVKQWQYTPTLLNGQAIPVRTQVTVVFALRDDQAEAGSGANAPSMPPPRKMNSKYFQINGQDWYFIVRATPIDDVPGGGEFQAPELDFPTESVIQWQMLARAGWPTNLAKGTPLSYTFTVTEEGDLKDFMRRQGPEIPNLEKELARVRVVSPGFRGSSLVRSQYTLELGLGLSLEEIINLLKSDRNHYGSAGTVQ